MAKRKRIVKDRAEIANLITKREGGKSQSKVGDTRQQLKILKNLEVQSILNGAASVVLLIRKEARKEAKAIMMKRKKVKAKKSKK